MAEKINSLSMVGHGTKGSDGIAEGIHLRWSFNDKLGFPPCFKLYRRLSDTSNMYHFPVEDTPMGDLILPYSVRVIQNDRLTYDLASLVNGDNDLGYVNVDPVTLPDGTEHRSLHIVEGKLTINFSRPVSRIEVWVYLDVDSHLSVSTRYNEEVSHPYASEGVNGSYILSFDAPGATGVVIEGVQVWIIAIETWLTKESGDEWDRINNSCGCGLPVNQEGTSYTNGVYANIGKDLAMALCRLGYRRVNESPITAAEFIELKAMLLTMTEEGMSVPVGWNLFPNEDGEDEETVQTFEFSKYDFLLTQSLQVFFAKILGLYFVDTGVDNNVYYDYRITAEWPEWNKRRLDHQLVFNQYQIGETLTTIEKLSDQVVLLAPKRPTVVDAVNNKWRTEKGIRVTSENLPIVISFLKPVTEVQLVLYNPGLLSGNPSIEVEAYQNPFITYVDKEVLFVERGMVRLRYKHIDYIKIKTNEAVISRINFDYESYPEGLQEYIISGIIKRNHLPLPSPQNLAVSFIPGGTISNEDGTLTEKPFLAGLRWDANEDPTEELLSVAPVLYHAERKGVFGIITKMTDEAPLFVAPSPKLKKKSYPLGWPEERQYLLDKIALNSDVEYRIAGLDLFGRLSPFTDFETYTVIPPKASHPLNVTAKYLDYSTYNPSDHTFSDVTLNADEKAWLETNGRSVIKVRWEWPSNLQLQAPQVDRFKVYFKPGWLNNYTGMQVTAPVAGILQKTSLALTEKERELFPIFDASPEELEVFRFKIELNKGITPPEPHFPTRSRVPERPRIAENFFRLCWLTQGNQSFLVVKNNDDPEPTLWVLKVYGEPISGEPINGKGLSIAVSPEKEFYIDYREPDNWPLELHEETKDTRTEYIVYVETIAFPYPAIEAEEVHKVRYGQIGVGSWIDAINGSVSPPATIMAVYRQQPGKPIAFQPDGNVEALKTTPANAYGKSSFALRWNKTALPVSYQVFRALDETLFNVDNELRNSRNESVYTEFKNANPDFNESDVTVIENIPFVKNVNERRTYYRNLSPLQWQILASLPDNSKAFTKINEGSISQTDPPYADRITDIPDPASGSSYVPDEDVLLYVDNTLNGKSNNYFFYALKSVDTNGLSSVLSLATLPVAIPKTTPPPAPVITSIGNGENQITIAWAKNPAAAITGYQVYRTQDKKNIGDWRKMELIKINLSDEFSVVVGEPLPDKQFEFIDTTIIARQPYYYGMIAIGLSDDGKWLKSGMSNVMIGQGYNLIPPDPPVWDEENSGWIYVDDMGVVFEWDDDLASALNPLPAVRLILIPTATSYICQVSRTIGYSSVGSNILNVQQSDSFGADQILIDKIGGVSQPILYKAKSKSAAGIISTAESSITINNL